MKHITLFTALLVLVAGPGCGTTRSNPRKPEPTPVKTGAADEAASPTTIAGKTPQQILKLFGYKGASGASERQLAGYRRLFGFLDADRDGRHSKKEYVDNGRYPTPQARQGIFRASDSNRDGFVSQAEYVENRMITDEAKEIFSGLDSNRNSRLSLEELLDAETFKEEKLARAVFKALDTNGNGELVIPEYLRVWGRWARS